MSNISNIYVYIQQVQITRRRWWRKRSLWTTEIHLHCLLKRFNERNRNEEREKKHFSWIYLFIFVSFSMRRLWCAFVHRKSQNPFAFGGQINVLHFSCMLYAGWMGRWSMSLWAYGFEFWIVEYQWNNQIYSMRDL